MTCWQMTGGADREGEAKVTVSSFNTCLIEHEMCTQTTSKKGDGN